jgi:hypothetical protein
MTGPFVVREQTAVDRGTTVFGRGQTATAAECRVACAGQDARVNKTWAGSNEIRKELIGRDLWL